MPDYIQELLSLARGGNTEQPKATDLPVLVNIAPEQRKSLRYNSPELDEYASFVEQRHGLPPGLIKAIKNSGERSNSNQVSPKGAQGVMQFIPGTWKQYGKDADPTDPVASIDAAGAYFKDLLQRYNGNVDAAVTEYNGGVKQAQAVAGGGNPWVPETVSYLARIRQALAQGGQGQPPQKKPVPVMSDPAIQPGRNLGGEAREEERRRREFEEQGAFTRGLGVVLPQMKQAAGAGMALFGSKTGNKDLQESGLDIYHDGSKEAEKFDDPSASLSNVLEGKGSFGDFAKYWAGNGLGQAVTSAITGLAGAAVGGAAGSVVPGAGTAAGTVSGFVGGVIGKGAVKQALVQGAEKLLAKEVQAGIARGLTKEAAEAAAAPLVKTWVAAETKKAGVRALAAAGAASGLYAQKTGMGLGETYGHYIDEMVRTGRPITPEDEDLALKSAMAAAGVETVADMMGLGRLLGGAKGAAANGFMSNIAKEVALGIGREVPTEVAQTAIERVGKQQPLDSAEAMREYVDAAGGAAVPGALFGAGAGVKRTIAPNSPLSNAATAAGGAGPAVQAPPATPGAPAPGAAPAGATAQGPAAQAPADPISEKVEALRPFLEDKELVRAIRNLPELGPESVNELLAAWALARNPNTNPKVRASLLDQIGQLVESVQNRPNWTFGKQAQPEAEQGDTPNVPAVPGQGQPPSTAPAPRLSDDGMTLDGQAREVPPAQLKAPPKPALETGDALRDRAQAMAEYEQAFQDLVKAEQLGESDVELQAKQKALQEAEVFKKQAEARLQEIRETIEGNRRLETERKRNAVLDSVLADKETVNPAERFVSELKRQGFGDTVPTPGELARIARFEDIKAAEQQAPDALPSAPNEFNPYEPPKERKNVGNKPAAANATVGAKRAQGGRDVAPRGVNPARVPPADGGNGRTEPSAPRVDAPVVRTAQPVRDAGSEQAPTVAPEAAPYFVLAPSGLDENGLAKAVEMPVWSIEEAQRKATEFIRRTGLSPEAYGAGIQVYDARTGQYAARINYDGKVVKTESREEAAARSAAAVAAETEKQKSQALPASRAPNLENKEQTNERNDQPPAESRGAAAASPAESQGAPLPRPAGPWSAEELNERGLVEDADAYMKARDTGGVILTGAINATIADREKALGLPLPGVGGRDGLPASLAITYDEGEYGVPEYAESFRVEFGGEALEIQPVEMTADEQIVGVPPLVLKRGEGEELYGFRVDGLPGDLFDFVDAVEQAYALLAERASRSPKGQQIDDQVATQLEGRDEPTDAQKEAENYQKAHVSVLGLEISVETEKGAQRTGKDKDGGEWSVTMPAHYGYIKGTRGADKDHLDIFLGPKPDNGQFYVVNQNQPDSGAFDEHKVMLGYDSPDAAQADYLLSFSDAFGGRVFGSIAGPFSLDEFKAMLPDLAKPKAVKARGAEVADVKPSAKDVESPSENASEIKADKPAAAPQEVESPAEGSLTPSVQSFKHTKTGETIYSVTMPVQVSREDYQAINRAAVRNGGRWSSFKGAGTIPGFHFKSEEKAKAFAGDQAVAGVLDSYGSQEASNTKILPSFPVDGYRLERFYANGAKVKPLPAKAFSQIEVQAIADWFKSIGWEVTSGPGSSGVSAVNHIGMTVDDIPAPYTAAQRKKDEARRKVDDRASDKQKAQDVYLASADAGKFVSEMFGDAMNRFNLAALAKVLAGDEKTFGGLFSRRAADVLAEHGIATEGRQVKDIVADIKAKFDESKHEEQARDAAKNTAKPAADLVAIFEGMESGGLAKNRAKKAAAEHPMAETIRAVDDGFHDMLMPLMDAGILEINGQKTITEDNKKCV